MELRQVELVIRRSGHSVQRVVLSRGVATVGRAEDSDVVLSDVGVSRHHARVHVERGGVRIEDCGSGNGTFLGSRKVASASAAVADGDEVRIDPFTLSFRMIADTPQAAAARIAAAPAARLEVVSAHAIGKGVFALPGNGIVTIGRSEANDVVLPEPGASRMHAEVQGAGGVWVVRDKGSGNGTFLNEIRISERRLEEGDRIRIGAVELRYTQGASPVEAEFSDRTENFDAVLHGGIEDPRQLLAPVASSRPESPPPPVAPRAARPEPVAPSRPEAPPPPRFEAARTLPPGELPPQMPFSGRGGGDSQPAPLPEPRVVRERERESRSPFSSPAVQIGIGVSVFGFMVVALFVGKFALDSVLLARSAAPPPAVVVVTPAAVDPLPAAVPGSPEIAPAAAPVPPAEPPVAVVQPPVPVPAAPSEAVEPAKVAPVASVAEPTPPAIAPETVATGAPAAPVRPPPGPAPVSEAGRLVAEGQQLFEADRLFESAALFYRALQMEPTNTDAEHWGYTACEFIMLSQMRGSMRNVPTDTVPVGDPVPESRSGGRRDPAID